MKSKAKAYRLFDSGDIAAIEIGNTKGLQQLPSTGASLPLSFAAERTCDFHTKNG